MFLPEMWWSSKVRHKTDDFRPRAVSPEMGGVGIFQWVQSNDWRITIPGFKNNYHSCAKLKTKIRPCMKLALFSYSDTHKRKRTTNVTYHSPLLMDDLFTENPYPYYVFLYEWPFPDLSLLVYPLYSKSFTLSLLGVSFAGLLCSYQLISFHSQSPSLFFAGRALFGLVLEPFFSCYTLFFLLSILLLFLSHF